MSAPAQYVANLELVLVKDVGGSTHHVYRDKPIPANADPENLAYLLSQGYVTVV